MSDEETLAVYATYAADYAKRFAQDKPDVHLRKFMAVLPTQARVLDLGCGNGRTTGFMVRAGIETEGWDASPEMAALGAKQHDVDIKVATFADLDAVDTYDGIFANFSLLHAPKSEMPDYLARIARALKPGGHLHIGLKMGKGETRDKLGRFYAYYSDPEITGLLNDVGLPSIDRSYGADVGLDGETAPWIILLAQKAEP
ncbi:MAG: class I SAM-dependent methyltransferase [Paracoccaceae bacterium]